MGFSSSKSETIESSYPTININLKIEGFNKIKTSKNISTHPELSNSYSIFGGEAPPSIGQEQKHINPQNNQSYNIYSNINEEHKNVNNNKSMEFSTNENIDNNNKDEYLKKRNENNTNFGNDINPNMKIDENLYSKKETSKGSNYKEEINPNMGNSDLKNNKLLKPSDKDNDNKYPENYKFFTKTGDNKDNNIEDEKKIINSPEENKDNNEKYDHPLDNSNNDLSKSILLASLQNISIGDPNDLLILKEIAIQKYNEGYYPLFVKMDHKITFYYLKKERTLTNLLIAHLDNSGIPYGNEKYSFYNNKQKKLSPDIPVDDIEDLQILSVVNIKKE